MRREIAKRMVIGFLCAVLAASAQESARQPKEPSAPAGDARATSMPEPAARRPRLDSDKEARFRKGLRLAGIFTGQALLIATCAGGVAAAIAGAAGDPESLCEMTLSAASRLDRYRERDRHRAPVRPAVAPSAASTPEGPAPGPALAAPRDASPGSSQTPSSVPSTVSHEPESSQPPARGFYHSSSIEGPLFR